MSFDIADLIIDRTQADVDRAKYLRGRVAAGTATEAEAAEWATALKGAYNASDMNRVGDALAYLVSRLNAHGYTVPGYAAQPTRSESDTPTEGDLTRYLQNVEAVRRVLHQAAGTPATPESMAGLTVDTANDIEKILAATDHLVTNISKAWYFSGEVYAGEV